MEKLEIDWKPLVKKSEEGKYFFKLVFNDCGNKYFAFCYVGYPEVMNSYKFEGERYKEATIYLKKKIGNKKYKTLYENSFQIGFYDSVIVSIHEHNNDVITNKIAAEERKDKIKLLLGN